MVGYNLTAISNNASTGYVGFVQAVNTELMFGWLGILFLVGIVAVFFLNFYFSTGNIKQTMIGTGFVGVGLSLLLRALSLIPDKLFFVCVAVFALVLAFSKLGGDD